VYPGRFSNLNYLRQNCAAVAAKVMACDRI
jgi:hypothetical protein